MGTCRIACQLCGYVEDEDLQHTCEICKQVVCSECCVNDTEFVKYAKKLDKEEEFCYPELSSVENPDDYPRMKFLLCKQCYFPECGEPKETKPEWTRKPDGRSRSGSLKEKPTENKSGKEPPPLEASPS